MANVKAFILLGFGYLLLFGALFNKGQYAANPWKGLGA